MGTLVGTPVWVGDVEPVEVEGEGATTMLEGTDWLVAESVPVGCIVCGALVTLGDESCVVGVVASGVPVVGDVLTVSVDGLTAGVETLPVEIGSVAFVDEGLGRIVLPGVDVFEGSVTLPLGLTVSVLDVLVPGSVDVETVLAPVPVGVETVLTPVPVGVEGVLVSVAGVVGVVPVPIVLGEVPVPGLVTVSDGELGVLLIAGEESDIMVLPVVGITVLGCETGGDPEATEEIIEERIDETSVGDVDSDGEVGKTVIPVLPVPEMIEDMIDEIGMLGPDGVPGVETGVVSLVSVPVGNGITVTPVPELSVVDDPSLGVETPGELGLGNVVGRLSETETETSDVVVG